MAAPQNAVAPLDPGAAVEDASDLAEAIKPVRRHEAPDIEAAEFVPAAGDGALYFKARIGVCGAAAIGADIVCGGRRRLSDSRTEAKRNRQDDPEKGC